MTSIFVSIYTQDILIRLTIIIKPIYIQNIQDIDWLEYMKKKKICSILLVVHLSLWFDIGQYTDVITFTFSQLFPWFVSIWHLFAPACTSLIIVRAAAAAALLCDNSSIDPDYGYYQWLSAPQGEQGHNEVRGGKGVETNYSTNTNTNPNTNINTYTNININTNTNTLCGQGLDSLTHT